MAECFWQGKIEVFGEKRVLVPLRSTQNFNWPGIELGLPRSGANHGTAHEYGNLNNSYLTENVYRS